MLENRNYVVVDGRPLGPCEHVGSSLQRFGLQNPFSWFNQRAGADS